jgi:hypothetical protein
MANCNSCKRTPALGNEYPPNTCPFRMADGRNFTDYMPSCMFYTMKSNTFPSSYEQRQYMIHHASELMKVNEQKAMESNGKCCAFDFTEAGTMLPEQNVISCNGKTCTSTMVNPNGLGDGRKY